MTTKIDGSATDAAQGSQGELGGLGLGRRTFLGTASKLAVSAAAAGSLTLGAELEAEAAPWDDERSRRDRELVRYNL